MEFLGVDSSTCEMNRSDALEGPPGAQVGGRLKAKVEQYLDFYSAANYWLDNQQAMMSDQLAMFRRGVENAPTDPNAFADSTYPVSYTHLRAHETRHDLVCRLL